MGSVPKKTLLSRVTATSSASSLSASGMGAGLFTLAMSTGWPCCNMGVTTMKMISNTSITSTMGVTLMSELTFAPSFLTEIAIEASFPVSPLRSTRRPDVGGAGAPAGDARPATHAGDCCLRGLRPAHATAIQEVIDQFAGGVSHLHVERFH